MAVVELTPEAREQFDALPAGMVARVEKLLDRMTHWPNVSGAKPLRGRLAGCYRMRTGDYRIQFRVQAAGADWLATVEKIGHRDGFYDDD
ncbi:MAG TPA: type II toxin-antitoxin system RelE/ParE family toxin [Pirellulales bacterium]|nr:type II toxin-antitoxin system RelE/ParE family toxin [Pirellulales bacterium]